MDQCQYEGKCVPLLEDEGIESEEQKLTASSDTSCVACLVVIVFTIGKVGSRRACGLCADFL